AAPRSLRWRRCRRGGSGPPSGWAPAWSTGRGVCSWRGPGMLGGRRRGSGVVGRAGGGSGGAGGGEEVAAAGEGGGVDPGELAELADPAAQQQVRAAQRFRGLGPEEAHQLGELGQPAADDLRRVLGVALVGGLEEG